MNNSHTARKLTVALLLAAPLAAQTPPPKTEPNQYEVNWGPTKKLKSAYEAVEPEVPDGR